MADLTRQKIKHTSEMTADIKLCASDVSTEILPVFPDWSRSSFRRMPSYIALKRTRPTSRNCVFPMNQLVMCVGQSTRAVFVYCKLKVKIKVSLCFTKHHAVKAYWGVESQLHAF